MFYLFCANCSYFEMRPNLLMEFYKQLKIIVVSYKYILRENYELIIKAAYINYTLPLFFQHYEYDTQLYLKLVCPNYLPQ